jgi:acetyl-CoA synthetase
MSINSVLHENRVFEPSADFVKSATVSGMSAYNALCQQATDDYEGFWAKLARELLVWHKPFSKTLNQDNAPFYKWFEDGELNVCANCLDKHLNTIPNKVAIIFEADDGSSTQVTFKELHQRVCQFANGLKKLHIVAGDRVLIYLPMGIEAVVAMQACARLGVTHSVVFGGFSAKSINERIIDAGAVAIITADGQFRGGKSMPLKNAVDEAIAMGGCESIKNIVVYKKTGSPIVAQANEIWWHDLITDVSDDCPPVMMGAEHPLFLLYTSGSTGKPKGVQHSSAGYLLHAMNSMRWTFDIKDNDIFWCTADVGWITGHSYVAYGPLAMGVTQVVFEGIPTYPDASRFWRMIEKHKVTIFYTAPTAIRSLIKAADTVESTHPKNFDLSSLRLLGSVGEPINPEAWMWYHKHIGKERCPVVDTWWQTETGAIMISPLPGVTTTKPGSATMPFPGIKTALLDTAGNDVGVGGGLLAITYPWPSMARTIWGDDARYVETYFSKWPGRPDLYFAGDGAKRDDDGYLWILGRVDDVLNIAGHRIGTMEVESALVDHPAVAEAAVVGKAHEIKGQALAAFVSLRAGFTPSSSLRDELRDHVATKIGAIARPDDILFSADLPKTRSGKIMRRLLRDIAEGRALGDTTTLADPSVVAALKDQYEAQES